MLEALIALAITAVLSIAATRGLATTRMNASKMREQLTIDAVADTIMNRAAERTLEEGRTTGRSGNLDWHVDVAPIIANARVLYSKASKQDDTKGPAGDATHSGPDATSTLATHTLSSQPPGQAGQDAAGAAPKKTVWQTF